MTDEIAPELEARLRRTLAIVAEATPAGDPAPTPLVARRHRRAVVWGPIVVLAAAGIVAAAVIARGDDARRVQTWLLPTRLSRSPKPPVLRRQSRPRPRRQRQ
jgi:hypothetical protein